MGSFTSYAKAQKAVAILSDTGEFPITDLSIVGVDLMEIEHVTGRLSWVKILTKGVFSGAWIGLFFAFILSFNSPGVTPMAVGVALGVIFGVVSSVVPYMMTKKTRGFSTTTQLVAARYDVICDRHTAPRARDIIARHSAEIAASDAHTF